MFKATEEIPPTSEAAEKIPYTLGRLYYDGRELHEKGATVYFEEGTQPKLAKPLED